jgi:orotate phosphoribosyltransferase
MIQYIKTEQLIRDAHKLAWMLPDKIRGVAGVPRSGMIAASVIATARSVPLYSASRNHEPTKLENGFRILGRTEPYGGPLVVVEDSVNSGQNLETFGTMRRSAATWSKRRCTSIHHANSGPMSGRSIARCRIISSGISLAAT